MSPPKCTWVQLKLLGGKLLPLHVLHLNILSPFTQAGAAMDSKFTTLKNIKLAPTTLVHTPQGHLAFVVDF